VIILSTIGCFYKNNSGEKQISFLLNSKTDQTPRRAAFAAAALIG
jgi:hypothetical protein